MMTPLLTGLVVVWLCGLLFLAGQYLNDIRIVFNNLNPEGARSQPSKPRWLVTAATSVPTSFLDATFIAATLLICHFFKLERPKTPSFYNMDPALVNEAGQAYLKKAVRHELTLLAWMIGGIAIIACAAIAIQAS
jgi:hypothetical protein